MDNQSSPRLPVIGRAGATDPVRISGFLDYFWKQQSQNAWIEDVVSESLPTSLHCERVGCLDTEMSIYLASVYVLNFFAPKTWVVPFASKTSTLEDVRKKKNGSEQPISQQASMLSALCIFKGCLHLVS